MVKINVIVVDISGNQIIDINISHESYINQVYNKLYKYFFHCKIKLLYNKKIIQPFQKICDISTDSKIIFEIVSHIKIKFFSQIGFSIHDVNSYIAVNTTGKIIDWMPAYVPSNSIFLDTFQDKFNFLKDYLNLMTSCLNIISIYCNDIYATILFENGQLFILCFRTKSQIKTIDNVTKVIKTRNVIGIIINNNKLIIYSNIDLKHIIGSLNLSSLDYKNIYANSDYFFVIGEDSITIFNPYCPTPKYIIKYKINNIFQIYDTRNSSIIAAIKEDYTLTSFIIETNDETGMSINPFEDINKQALKIKLMLSLNLSFVALTYDDKVIIWGHDKHLIKQYEVLQDKLIDVEDVVLTEFHIGILKRDNSIIIIHLNIRNYYIYETSECKYLKIISTRTKMYVLGDNNIVYELQNDFLPYNIKLLEHNIKDLYSNSKDNILLISHDNIVYAYDFLMVAKNKSLYFEQQILDYKSVMITDKNFFIIRTNNELIEIKCDDANPHFKDIEKFIKI